jgi:uncharacterized protein (DUF1684 family)
MRRLSIGLLAGLLLAAAGPGEPLVEWRAHREEALRAPDGWLSLAGLDWLREGSNSIRGVEFILHGDTVTAKLDGVTRVLKPDTPDHVARGSLQYFVIKRGDRYGIRLKDANSKYRSGFTGLAYFPASDAWRITARFVAQPRQIPILNVLGQTEPMECPGYAEFTVAGRKLRLYPVLETPGARQLFFIFRDLTSGKETYAASRFLYSDLPVNGTVVLDFNEAYNPPCAFTPYATCPLPPSENRLPVRVTAGELKYGAH